MTSPDAFTSRHSMFGQPPQTKTRVLSGMSWTCPHKCGCDTQVCNPISEVLSIR
jgi:hypothetical protein